MRITHLVLAQPAPAVLVDEMPSGEAMVDDAVAKCRAGLTSAPEVLRVTSIR